MEIIPNPQEIVSLISCFIMFSCSCSSQSIERRSLVNSKYFFFSTLFLISSSITRLLSSLAFFTSGSSSYFYNDAIVKFYLLAFFESDKILCLRLDYFLWLVDSFIQASHLCVVIANMQVLEDDLCVLGQVPDFHLVVLVQFAHFLL